MLLKGKRGAKIRAILQAAATKKGFSVSFGIPDAACAPLLTRVREPGLLVRILVLMM